MNYRFNNGVPNQITQYATPYTNRTKMNADLGIYAQDQWVLGQLTLNLGLRFDYFNGSVPASDTPATPSGWIPRRTFDEVKDVPSWKDLNPRVGAAYDLFGDGRTALKVSLGRYVAKTGVDIANANNPIQTSVNSVTRTWTDTNGNYVPDCSLGNFGANGECGAVSDSELRQGRDLDPLGRRRAARVRRARLQLGHVVGDPAPAERRDVADGRLLPQLVRQLQRHRQPRRRSGGLRHLLHHGAVRPASAGRRRLPGLRTRRRQPGEVRPGEQRGHAGSEFRRSSARSTTSSASA